MNSKSLLDMTEEAKRFAKNELPAAYLLMSAPDEAALLKKYRPRKCLKSEVPVGAIFPYSLPVKRLVSIMAVLLSCSYLYKKRIGRISGAGRMARLSEKGRRGGEKLAHF